MNMKKETRIKITIASFLLTLYSGLNCAANVTQVNRYAIALNKPLASQVNPLLTVQQIHFPQNVQTVGEAINFWLHYSGFTLASSERLPVALKEFLDQPLPQTDRNLGPLSVQDGLEVLAGQQVFSLIQDPLHRKVSFKLKPQYAHLLQKQDLSKGQKA